VRLDRGVLRVLKLADGLHDHVRFGEPLLHVTDVDIDIRDDVAGRLVDPSRIVLVVDHRRARGEGVVDRQNSGKLIVFDLYRLYRLLGDLPRLGRNGGDPVTDEPHLGVEHPRIVRGRFGVPLAGGGEPPLRGVLVGQDEGDPGDRLGIGGVDPDDLGVGMRASQDLDIQGVGEVDVGDEFWSSGDKRDPINFPVVVADHAEFALLLVCRLRSISHPPLPPSFAQRA